MNFSDTLLVLAKTYEADYAIFNGKAYLVDEEGSVTDEICDIDITREMFDKDMNPIQPSNVYLNFGKCFISFNSAGQLVTLNDGKEYQYTYYVICPLTKKRYNMIPREGDFVRIIKADGTIDREMIVRGFVTMKNKYLKLWL